MLRTRLLLMLLSPLPLVHAAPACAAFPTTVTYQGELRENGAPREGTIDLAFAITDEQGQASQILLVPDVALKRGLFTAPLSLNPLVTANAQNYKMLVGVREGSLDAGEYQFLLPAQPLTAVPFALNASLLDGNTLGSVLQKGPGIKRSTFSYVTFPAVPTSAEFASLTVLPPISGTLVVRASGYCNLQSNGQANKIALSIGTTEADAAAALSATWGAMGIEANSPDLRSMFSTERNYPVAQETPMTVKLFGRRETGNGSANCSGSLSALLLPGTL